MNIKEALKILSKGEDLSVELMSASMEEVMTGQASQAQIGAFLGMLSIKGESIEEITQAAKVMREKASNIIIEGDLLDTCSTGGTGLKHFNISTTTAFVVAALGVKVAKHGNRAASGLCGSADVLETLGVNINLRPESVAKCIKDLGIGFLFARTFHQAMKFAAGPRKELGIRTIFNLLGPLTNPAFVKRQVLGVYDPKLAPVFPEVLKSLGIKNAFVVHGAGGLDEFSLAGENLLYELREGKIQKYNIFASDFGLPNYEITQIRGGTPVENAKITLDVLSGGKGAYRDFILANASAALVIADISRNFKEGVLMASESIDSGKAYSKLKELIAYSMELE